MNPKVVEEKKRNLWQGEDHQSLYTHEFFIPKKIQDGHVSKTLVLFAKNIICF
jgi:hypothetical protein